MWKIVKEMRISDHLTCLLGSLYVGQEATVRTRTTDWFKIKKGVWLGCILLLCLFKLYVDYVLAKSTPWAIASQAPLPMGFPRQEYWSGLPFTSPGDLPHTGIKPKQTLFRYRQIEPLTLKKKKQVLISCDPSKFKYFCLLFVWTHQLN